MLNNLNMVGPVITADDWLRISLTNYSLYRILAQEDNNGKCFSTTIAIAMYVPGCELVYGSMKLEDGSDTAHVVLLKNGWVYDSNHKIHLEYEEYKKKYGFEEFIRKKLSRIDYKDFLNNILERYGYRKWCEEKNVSLFI